MAKVGLKETLQLLAAGYKKKDIEALAAIDETENLESDVPPDSNNGSLSLTDQEQDQENQAQPDPEPDYKALYEEQLKKAKEAEEKLKKVQKDNINSNSAPDAAAAKEKQSEDLLKLVSSFM